MGSYQRNYSGPVQGEVVIQGDLHAQGNINIVTNTARSMFRSITESPEAFGSMQAKIQGMISTLMAVSSVTDDYVHEQRLDSASQSCLLSLAGASQITLSQLRELLADFEKWGMQDIREEEVINLTERLGSQIQGLEGINGRIRETTIQLEKLLQNYISQVQNGERTSSIHSIVSSLSATSSDQAWAQLRQEMQDIGISPQKFKENRDMIILNLQRVLLQEVEQSTTHDLKKVSRLRRLISLVTANSHGLLEACTAGRLDDVQTALLKGADIETRNHHGLTALSLAAREGHADIVKLLLTRAEPNVVCKDGLTPLHSAVNFDRLNTVQILLKHKVDVNTIDRSGCTPLYSAVASKRYGIVRSLLDNRANVNKATVQGYPPLYAAVKNGQIDMVVLLLEAQADTEQAWPASGGPSMDKSWRQNFGPFLPSRELADPRFTNPRHIAILRQPPFRKITQIELMAIHEAITHDRVDIIRLLLGRNMNVNVFTKACPTPLQWAVRQQRESLVELLLDSGAAINSVGGGKVQDTALHQAAFCGNEKIVRLLLDRGAKVILSRQGTPLHMATGARRTTEGHLRVVETLITNGANVNVKDRSMMTPLHLAASFDYIKGQDRRLALLDFLLDNGADLTATDYTGCTPLETARRYGYPENIRLLRISSIPTELVAKH